MDIYIDASVANLGYTTHVNDARADYTNISYSNIGYTTTASSSLYYTDVRVYAIRNRDVDYAGKVNPRGSNGAITAYNSSWSTVDILINDANMDDFSYSYDNRRKIVLHEFGHALSMVHQPNGADSVMNTGRYSYTNPRSLDIYNLQYKY